MSSHFVRLKDLLIDLVQQLNEPNTILDQRHFRMLLHLTSVEKVCLLSIIYEDILIYLEDDCIVPFHF